MTGEERRKMAQMKSYRICEYIEKLEQRGMIERYELYGKDDTIVDMLTYNSKEAAENTLFICKGAAFKLTYLREALSKGAVCYISEKKFELEGQVPYILVKCQFWQTCFIIIRGKT